MATMMLHCPTMLIMLLNVVEIVAANCLDRQAIHMNLNVYANEPDDLKTKLVHALRSILSFGQALHVNIHRDNDFLQKMPQALAIVHL